MDDMSFDGYALCWGCAPMIESNICTRLGIVLLFRGTLSLLSSAPMIESKNFTSDISKVLKDYLLHFVRHHLSHSSDLLVSGGKMLTLSEKFKKRSLQIERFYYLIVTYPFLIKCNFF